MTPCPTCRRLARENARLVLLVQAMDQDHPDALGALHSRLDALELALETERNRRAMAERELKQIKAQLICP